MSPADVNHIHEIVLFHVTVDVVKSLDTVTRNRGRLARLARLICHFLRFFGFYSQQNKKKREPRGKQCHAKNYDDQEIL